MSELIYIIAGARPNFMKIAPLIVELKKHKINFRLIHTGQHYDYNMSKIFFNELGIPEPDVHLNIGYSTNVVQTAKIMLEFEKEIQKEKPKLLIVVGDVNSTLACVLVAANSNIKTAHIESGLRSFDRKMPEEINRLLTDQISDYLFTSEPSGKINLLKEGIMEEKIFYVGNIMIDTLISNIEKVNDLEVLKKYNLEKHNYALITFHRPSNVDNKEILKRVLKILNYLQEKIKIFIPIHPRTKKNIEKYNLKNKLEKKNIILSEPIGYFEFLSLMMNSKLILTDSGGIQEEGSFLKIPLLTLRENTERPVTVDKGTNTIIGTDFTKAKIYIDKILSNNYKTGQDIEFWDGKTAERIVKIIKKKIFN